MADQNAVEIAIQLRNETQKGITAIRGGLSSIADTAKATAGAIFNFQNALAAVGVGIGLAVIAEDFRKAEQAAIDAAQGSTEALEKLQTVSREVWLEGFGANAAEAAQMVNVAFKEMGDISEQELGRAAIAAKQLEERFGADYEKSIQSMGVLMRDFGLTAQESMDFVSAGFIKNLDASGDFLDSILEYSPQFDQTRKGAESLFSIIETGALKGVLGVDKATDAFGEMRKRVLGGGTAIEEAFASLGISYDKIVQNIESGSMDMTDVFNAIQKAVKDSETPVSAFQQAVALVGTQFEDMGEKAFANIDLSKKSIEDLAGSTEKLDQQYVGLTQSITKLSREIIDAFSGEILSGSKAVEDQINEIIKVVQELKANGSLAEWASGAKDAFAIVLGIIKEVIDYIPQLNKSVQSGFASVEIKYKELLKLLEDFRAWGAKLSGNKDQEEYFKKNSAAIQSEIDALKGLKKELDGLVPLTAKSLSGIEDMIRQSENSWKILEANVEDIENGTLKWGKTAEETNKKVTKTTKDSADATFESWNKVHQGLVDSANEFQQVWENSILKTDQALQQDHSFEIQTEPAEQSLFDIGRELDGVVVKVEGPYSMEINTSPTLAALQEIKKEAEATAIANKKAFLQAQDDLKNASGEAVKYLRASLNQYDRDFREATAKIEDYQNRINKELKTTIEFKGKASPEKPLSETINDVSNKMKTLENSIVEPKNFDVYFSDMGVKDGVYDIATLLDRSKVSMSDAVDYIETAMAETAEFIKKGIDPASIAQPYYEIGKLIEAEAKNMGEKYGNELVSMQDSFSQLASFMNQPLPVQIDIEPAKHAIEQIKTEVQTAQKSLLDWQQAGTFANFDLRPATDAQQELTKKFKDQDLEKMYASGQRFFNVGRGGFPEMVSYEDALKRQTNIKNMGSLDVKFNGKGGTIMGEQDVLDIMKKAFQNESRMGY